MLLCDMQPGMQQGKYDLCTIYETFERSLPTAALLIDSLKQ